MGAYFTENNWIESVAVAQTFATIGLVGGALFGVALINFAVRKGYTHKISNSSNMSEHAMKGLVKEGERESMGDNTVSSMSIDPLTWHIILIMMSVGGAFAINDVLRRIVPSISFPVYAIALILSAFMQKFLTVIKLNKYVDRRVIVRIGSTVTDFLIAFAIATLNLKVVADNILPILIMCVVGFALAIFFTLVLSRIYFKNLWFERGIYIFGWSTGVMSMGITLLRIVDPDLDTGVLEDNGLAWTFISLIDVAVVTFLPVLIIQGFGLPAAIALIAIAIGMLLLSGKLYGVNKYKKESKKN